MNNKENAMNIHVKETQAASRQSENKIPQCSTNFKRKKVKEGDKG